MLDVDKKLASDSNCSYQEAIKIIRRASVQAQDDLKTTVISQRKVNTSSRFERKRWRENNNNTNDWIPQDECLKLIPDERHEAIARRTNIYNDNRQWNGNGNVTTNGQQQSGYGPNVQQGSRNDIPSQYGGKRSMANCEAE